MSYALQCLRENVEMERNSDASMMYGRMVENLKTQVNTANEISGAKDQLLTEEKNRRHTLSAKVETYKLWASSPSSR